MTRSVHNLKEAYGKRVRVHWHFTRKLYSISDYERDRGWRVIRDENKKQVFCGKAILRSPIFRVHRSGWERTKVTGKKNVHAWVEGKLVSARPEPYPTLVPHGTPVRYSPANDVCAFVTSEGGIIKEAEFISLGIDERGKPKMVAFEVD